jgi:L-amino acid N-acyltransferase YncA
VLGATDVFAGIQHGNEASVRVVRRLGFRHVVAFATYDRFHRRLAEGTADPTAVSLRPATPEDLPFLEKMLVEAVGWDPDRPRHPDRDVLADERNTHYVEGWGRPGDLGVIAEADDTSPIGAAWCRLFTTDRPGYGFVATDVPELGIGVIAGRRGGGIGTRLLDGLLAAAADAGHRSISLSVEDANPSARLYRRTGFVEQGRAEGSITMVRRLEVP